MSFSNICSTKPVDSSEEASNLMNRVNQYFYIEGIFLTNFITIFLYIAIYITITFKVLQILNLDLW